MTRVCILDYGSGNVRSVFNLFARLSTEIVISNEPQEIERASHLILPGVGAFGAAMRKIRETLPLADLERSVLIDKKPFLGICVGMQVLAEHGLEFGRHDGLAWIGGVVEKLESAPLPLPHIGWNSISVRSPSRLLSGLNDETDFYFLHSYSFRPSDPQHTAATASYGVVFASVVERDNLYGVQFHPEKSQAAGLKLAKNFLSIQ